MSWFIPTLWHCADGYNAKFCRNMGNWPNENEMHFILARDLAWKQTLRPVWAVGEREPSPGWFQPFDTGWQNLCSVPIYKKNCLFSKQESADMTQWKWDATNPCHGHSIEANIEASMGNLKRGSQVLVGPNLLALDGKNLCSVPIYKNQ